MHELVGLVVFRILFSSDDRCRLEKEIFAYVLNGVTTKK